MMNNLDENYVPLNSVSIYGVFNTNIQIYYIFHKLVYMILSTEERDNFFIDGIHINSENLTIRKHYPINFAI